MPSPNLVVLYVRDPAASSRFYRKLLDCEPSASFPTYVAFELENGLTLGLWSAARVNPPPPEFGSRSEIAFSVGDQASVEALFRDWNGAGVTIEQEPWEDVFGLTFVALDLDGHRIRVCS